MSENSKVRLFFKIVLLLYLRCEDIWDEVEKLAKKLE